MTAGKLSTDNSYLFSKKEAKLSVEKFEIGGGGSCSNLNVENNLFESVVPLILRNKPSFALVMASFLPFPLYIAEIFAQLADGVSQPWVRLDLCQAIHAQAQ